MRPKLHVPPCKFCSRKFQRREHLNRHERTHTREKPFSCHCGRSFSRRDLLSRHERIYHNDDPHDTIDDDGNIIREDGRGGMGITNVPDDGSTAHVNPIESRSLIVHSSDRRQASIEYPPEVQPVARPDSPHERRIVSPPIHEKPGPETPATTFPALAVPLDPALVSMEHNPLTMIPDQHSVQAALSLGFGDDLDLLWNEFDYSSLVMSQSFPLNDMALTQAGLSGLDQAAYGNPGETYDNQQAFSSQAHGMPGIMSRFESRLPSLEPSYQDQNQPNSDDTANSDKNKNEPLQAGLASVQPPNIPWRISKRDYSLISAVIDSHATILPPDFLLPSRHALCRYVEGFFSGFHEHLPVIHTATFTLVTEAPELILAILSVGARYRFQHRQSHSLYQAAQALLDHQLQRREPHNPSTSGSEWATPETASHHSNSLHQQHQRILISRPSPTNSSTRADGPPSRISDPDRVITTPERDFQTMHAMILIIALGTWNHQSLLKDAFSIATHLAILFREHILQSDHHSADQTWPEWLAAESRRRTLIVSFCFLNLHSIAYNSPPKILVKDMGSLILPGPESHWRAASGASWEEARQKDHHSSSTLHEAYAKLRVAEADRSCRRDLSSFGNYVLIHYVIQDIFFARQLYFTRGSTSSVAPEALAHLDWALRSWQHGWEATKDSSFDPSAPGGPLSFNSTALFRLAYSRLHTDMGAHLQLDARSPSTIATAFQNSLPIERSPQVGLFVARAVLQCAHSLSIPVRIGIEFVARTQTLSWSIIHSLCNLECGLFVGKWLQTVAYALRGGEILREDERRLLGIISAIVSETDLGSSIQNEADQVKRVLYLSAAVLRLWAYTFQGAHVFEIMGPIGAGLDLCADSIAQDLD